MKVNELLEEGKFASTLAATVLGAAALGHSYKVMKDDEVRFRATHAAKVTNRENKALAPLLTRQKAIKSELALLAKKDTTKNTLRAMKLEDDLKVVERAIQKHNDVLAKLAKNDK